MPDPATVARVLPIGATRGDDGRWHRVPLKVLGEYTLALQDGFKIADCLAIESHAQVGGRDVLSASNRARIIWSTCVIRTPRRSWP